MTIKNKLDKSNTPKVGLCWGRKMMHNNQFILQIYLIFKNIQIITTF